MGPHEGEFFGDPARIPSLRRSRALWDLMRGDPCFGYYGRFVPLVDHRRDAAVVLPAVSLLTGAGVAHYTEKSRLDDLYTGFEAAGFVTDRHEQYQGSAEAFRAARALVADRSLPAGLDLLRLDTATPSSLLAEVAAMAATCGVTMGSADSMRGQLVPGVMLVAMDGAHPVSCAMSYRHMHADHPRATDVFWGGLATAESHRGDGIGLYLGAMAMIEMQERHGAEAVYSGVRQDNEPSQRLCARLAVYDTQWCFAQCLNPELLGGRRGTK